MKQLRPGVFIISTRIIQLHLHCLSQFWGPGTHKIETAIPMAQAPKTEKQAREGLLHHNHLGVSGEGGRPCCSNSSLPTVLQSITETQLFRTMNLFVKPVPPQTQGSPRLGETLLGGEVKTPSHPQPGCQGPSWRQKDRISAPMQSSRRGRALAQWRQMPKQTSFLGQPRDQGGRGPYLACPAWL